MPARQPFGHVSPHNEEVIHKQETVDDVFMPRKEPRGAELYRGEAQHDAPKIPIPNCEAQELGIDDVQTVRRAMTILPRPLTSHRQHSAQRQRLLPVPHMGQKRRTNSADPKQSQRGTCPRTDRSPMPFMSAPELVPPFQTHTLDFTGEGEVRATTHMQGLAPNVSGQFSMHEKTLLESDDMADDDFVDADVEQHFRDHWILNLSMHFRDESNREKFFMTYAQKPNLWRRLTISLDYKNALAGSLEAELDDLHFQRDKSFRIYDALRESLPEIQFYDTVTNLKLTTEEDDGQLHVHVREDTNEIIDYPAASLLSNVHCVRVAESQLSFHSHISGFVYKVVVQGQVLIKKEIPGPDTIDEFLYEVTALDGLSGCPNVIQLEGLVTSEDGTKIRGLLLSYASQGALVDVLYDRRPEDLPMSLRVKWARQIVSGLLHIHEAGFVQGDFTLSNIVICTNDDARIIDINRRGCPVGWEPPELSVLIEQGQRISMYIGVKTDLFQLGMVLWALARLVDEPERCIRPLPDLDASVPEFYRRVVALCLNERPQARSSATTLLQILDDGITASLLTPREPHICSDDNTPEQATTSLPDNQYAVEVTLDDIKHSKQEQAHIPSYRVACGSSNYIYNESSSSIIPRSRGRSPGQSSRRRRSSMFDGATSATSLSTSPSRATQQAHCDQADFHYPREISQEDLVEVNEYSDRGVRPSSAAVLVRHHVYQTEDSGFDENMIENMYENVSVQDGSGTQLDYLDTTANAQRGDGN